jgi:hypothetical protein
MLFKMDNYKNIRYRSSKYSGQYLQLLLLGGKMTIIQILFSKVIIPFRRFRDWDVVETIPMPLHLRFTCVAVGSSQVTNAHSKSQYDQVRSDPAPSILHHMVIEHQ